MNISIFLLYRTDRSAWLACIKYPRHGVGMFSYLISIQSNTIIIINFSFSLWLCAVVFCSSLLALCPPTGPTGLTCDPANVIQHLGCVVVTCINPIRLAGRTLLLMLLLSKCVLVNELPLSPRKRVCMYLYSVGPQRSVIPSTYV